MSNQWCSVCGGLDDRIGLQPQGVRLCACKANMAALRERLSGCQTELREIAQALDDPRVHNTMTISECIKALQAKLAAERARANDFERRLQDVIEALPNTAEYLDPPDGGDVAIGEQVRRMRAHRDRLRAAGRSLLACPHIAERDTDPDWIDAETEAAVAEMRAALKET